MPQVETKYFGNLSYSREAVFDFPQGLPAFEDERAFVLIEVPENEPLVFLQSLREANLCFLAFPVLVVARDYQLAIAAEDLEALELDTQYQPALGDQVLVLALISLRDGILPTANLMAPVVLNLKTRRGLQTIRRDALYSHQHPVAPQEPAQGERC
jgi:flagellar assembly factor FliW